MRTGGPHVPDWTPGIAMIAWYSMGLPKPNTSNITNVTGYASYRKISWVRTERTVSLIVMSVSGSWSPAKPGSIPDA
jgi:hypothetical protein